MTPDGVEIAYRDYGGAGPDVVLLPGIGGNLEAEHATALELAHRWRIVTMDPRGIGQSGESETITAADLVVDVETVVETLRLHHPAVVGHSLGGIVAGCYGTVHPDVPVVSIDGFDAGVASVGTAEDQETLHRFMNWARLSLRAMTAAPDEGDDDWRSKQIQSINAALDAMGFHAANRAAMVARQFVHLPDGRWRRHPSAKLVDAAERAAFATEPPANIVRMFRTCTGPVLILRCTKSEWPNVLDAELDDLVATHPNITVRKLPLTHTGPATDGVEMTVAEISKFLSMHHPKASGVASSGPLSQDDQMSTTG
jgi:pimeloyl-ACP methyl ester carboxylesterase